MYGKIDTDQAYLLPSSVRYYFCIAPRTEVPLAPNNQHFESSALVRKRVRWVPGPRTTVNSQLWVLKLGHPVCPPFLQPNFLSFTPVLLFLLIDTLLSGAQVIMSVQALSKPSTSSETMKAHKMPPRFPCSHCDKVFKRSEHRARHERSRTVPRQICRAQNTDIMSDTKEKPFVCRYCGRRYARKSVDFVT